MDALHYDPDLLREWREERGLSVAEAADAARCARMTVYRAEKGSFASFELLARLAALYGHPVSLLLRDRIEPAGLHRGKRRLTAVT